MRVVVGDELAVAVTLAGCSCGHANAEGEGLLQQDHEHGGQHARAVAARGIIHRHVGDGQRLGGDGRLALGVDGAPLYLQPCAEACGLYHGGLIDVLVGQHQAHVAIDADGGLFTSVDALGEVGGDEIDALDQLAADERAGFVEVVGMVFHLDIGRGVAVIDELAREGRVRLVDHRHRRLVQRLVVVYPRVEQRVAQRHDDEEHQHALVLEDLHHLAAPDVEHVGEVLLDSFNHKAYLVMGCYDIATYGTMGCRHNSALRFLLCGVRTRAAV